jgi:glycerol-3-phosphate acyltransferase PlsX
MRIAIDAMGGDYAPEEIIKGAVTGAREYGAGLLLVGPQATIEKELAKYDHRSLDIEILHTDEYLVEGEQAAYALRQKRQASILRAVKAIKEGRAAAAIGAGPTGGVFASALQVLGTLEGISRPVVGSPIIGFTPNTFLVDLGGNVDSRPDQLLDYAIIGTVYARKWMNIPEPTVALLSNGKEEGKGNDMVKQTYALFKKSGLNFIGNVEGNDLAMGKANVVVCDGFVGNCLVKFCEGLGAQISDWMKNELKGKIAENEIQRMVNALLQATVPADTSGGGPLLAVNGIVCKAHGRSKAPEIALTVGTAKRAVELDMVGTFKAELAAVRARLNLAR